MECLTTNQIMSNQLVFATNNPYKTAEVRALLTPKYDVVSLQDIGCTVDIPETGSTFAENASLKSSYVSSHYQLNCFGDDSGLEVAALDNEPGIYSARYSGQKDDAVNLLYLLEKMKGISNRKARFTTVISLVFANEHYLFEGVINGKIRHEPVGENGFGYDPIFEPEGYGITFAEMDMATKNTISHRAIAMQKLIHFLQTR